MSEAVSTKDGNRVFAVCVETNGHVFGGLCGGDKEYSAIPLGIDYGGRGFLKGGFIGSNCNAQYTFLLPISGQAAARFETLIDRLITLESIWRLPYYFSSDLRFNPWFEPEGETPLDIDGSPCKDARPQRFYPKVPATRYYTSASSITVHRDDLLYPPGIRRVAANCLTVFKAVADMSGINLGFLGADVAAAQERQESITAYAKCFRQAADGPLITFEHEEFVRRDLSLPSGHQATALLCLTGGESRSHVPVRAMFHAHGGYEGYLQSIAGHAPFDCEPAPVPAYLAAEFARLEPQTA